MSLNNDNQAKAKSDLAETSRSDSYIKLKLLGMFDGEAHGVTAIVALTLLGLAIVALAVLQVA